MLLPISMGKLVIKAAEIRMTMTSKVATCQYLLGRIFQSSVAKAMFRSISARDVETQNTRPVGEELTDAVTASWVQRRGRQTYYLPSTHVPLNENSQQVPGGAIG